MKNKHLYLYHENNSEQIIEISEKRHCRISESIKPKQDQQWATLWAHSPDVTYSNSAISLWHHCNNTNCDQNSCHRNNYIMFLLNHKAELLILTPSDYTSSPLVHWYWSKHVLCIRIITFWNFTIINCGLSFSLLKIPCRSDILPTRFTNLS